MDTVTKSLGDDLDLDALMIRVREAALAGGASSGMAGRQDQLVVNGEDVDLARVLEAQGEWNEQARQSLAALVESLRTLRDDVTEAHARLQGEVRRLSAAVSKLRAKRAPVKRRSATGKRGKRRS